MTDSLPHWRRNAPPGLSLAQAARSAGAGHPSAPMPVVAARESWPLKRILRPDATPRWSGYLARNYDPSHIETVLRYAIAGDHVSAWDLFNMMEDTWPRLSKAINELKRTVGSRNWLVNPWAEEDESPTPEASHQAAIVSKALWGMRPASGTAELGFQDAIYDILDAWTKGISVLEIDWETRSDRKLGDFFAPRCLRWVKPDCYAWSEDREWLGLRPEAVAGATDIRRFQPIQIATIDRRGALVPIPEDKFVVAICRSRTNHPLAGALLRPLAFWWCAANFAAEWFMNFAQVFGLPIRWAKYDKNIPGLFENVCAMLEQMGSAAWAAFPSGTELELKEPSKGGTDNPSFSLLEHADRQCDLLVLGQTLTTDVADSGSRALGTVHAEVRTDVMSAAADWLEGVLRDQLVRPICRLNWGSDDDSPEISGEPDKLEDEKANAERVAILLGAGVELPKAWLYKHLKIPLPLAGEEVVGKPQPPAPLSPFSPSEPPEPPVSASQADDASETIDDIVRLAVADAAGVRTRWLAPLRSEMDRLIAAAKNPAISDAALVQFIADATRAMPEIFSKLDKDALAKSLEAAMGAAALAGVKDRVGTARG